MRYALFTVMLPDLTPEQIVRELKKSGYAGVEWRIHADYHFNPHTLEKDAHHIKTITEEAGLVIANLGSYVAVQEYDLARRIIQAAAVMQAPSMRLRVPAYNPQDGYTELVNRTQEQLFKYLPLLKDTKVKLLIEIHHTTITPSASSAYALLKDLPSEHYGVIYDPANMIIEGKEQWLMGVDILGSYLHYLHAKNVMWFKDNRSWKHAWAALPDGMVDWKEVFFALKKVHYQGFISVENLFQVPLKTSGLVNEFLGQNMVFRPWEERITNDIDYLKWIEQPALER